MFGNHNELHNFTDALLRGQNNAPYADDDRVADLQRLARRLDAAMEPVEPRREFLDELRTSLYQRHAELEPEDERVARTTKVFGRVVSVFAATAVASHVIGALVVLVTFIVERGRRNRTTAAA